MKMKVRVAALKAAIVKHQKDDEERFAKESAAYRKLQAANTVVHLRNVREYLRTLEAGRERLGGYQLGQLLDRGVATETEPHKVAKYGDLLKKLNLVVTDTVIVDDKSEYVRFLSGKCVC